MKYLLLIALFIFSFQLSAQDISDCYVVSLEKVEDVNNAEPCVLKLADFVLNHPLHVEKDEKEVDFAVDVIIGWMKATPRYGFTLNSKMLKLADPDNDNVLLFRIYMATLAKAALLRGKTDNKYALELFVNYVKNPKNKVKQTKAIKKLIKNWEKGKIDAYIK